MTTATALAEAAAPRVRRRTRGRRRATALLLPWLSPVLIVVVWAFASHAGWIDENVIPSPGAVLDAARELQEQGDLLPALSSSLSRVAVGTVLGLTFGLALGLLSGYFALGELAVDRPLQMLRAIPFNALLPLFIIAFGVGESMKVFLIAEGVLIPMYLNTFAGIRNVDPKLVELAVVYRMSRRLVAFKILLMGALPSVLTGLRFSLAIAWIALVTSETVNTTSGIGFILIQAQRFVRPDQVVLCIVIYALLGVATDWIVRLLERRLLRWRAGFTGR